jgi:hypothetical protein
VSPTTEPTPQAHALMTAVVTNEGCTYEGPSQIAPGEITITVTNASPTDFADLSIHPLRFGHTFAEFDAAVDEVRSRIDEGEPLIGPPFYAPMLAVAAGIEPGASAELTYMVAAGQVYALAGGTLTGTDFMTTANSICAVEAFEVLTPAESATMNVVVTDDGCTYDGPARILPGQITFSATNEGTERANAVLHHLREGYSLADAEASIREAQGLIDAGSPAPLPAWWMPDLAGVTELDPGESGEATYAVRAGQNYIFTGGTYTGPVFTTTGVKTICLAGGFEVVEVEE